MASTTPSAARSTAPPPADSAPSSEGSAPGPVVLSSSDSDSDQVPASKKPRRDHWPFCDEVKILTALAAHRPAGRLPSPSVLFRELQQQQQQLYRKRFAAGDLAKKVAHLKGRFVEDLSTTTATAAGARRRRQDTTLFDLSKKVWPELLPPPPVTVISSSSSPSSSSSSSSC